MSAKVVAFLGLKSGQGKTTLIHHLSWMFSDLGVPVLAADLDPQGDLTHRFLGPDGAAEIDEKDTISGALKDLIAGQQGAQSTLIAAGGHIALLAGDVALWKLASSLEEAWARAGSGQEKANHALGAIQTLLADAAARHGARLVLLDLGPGLGGAQRAALAAADYFVVPIVPDAFAVRALRFLGEQLCTFREEWQTRRGALPWASLRGPDAPEPLGYVVQMLPAYTGRSMGSSDRVLRELPAEYGRWIAQSPEPGLRSPAQDEHCLGILSPLHILVPIASDANKPVFHLTPADGAVGSTMKAVQRFRTEFDTLARTMAEKLGITFD